MNETPNDHRADQNQEPEHTQPNPHDPLNYVNTEFSGAADYAVTDFSDASDYADTEHRDSDHAQDASEPAAMTAPGRPHADDSPSSEVEYVQLDPHDPRSYVDAEFHQPDYANTDFQQPDYLKADYPRRRRPSSPQSDSHSPDSRAE